MAFEVIVADDHPMVRAALRGAIETGFPGARVIEVGSLDAAESAVQSAEPDLLLLDLNMPGMDGFSGLAGFRARHPAVPVMIVSAAAEAHHRRAAEQLGAAGYVPKSAPMEELTAAIAAVLAGEVWFPDLGDALDPAPAGGLPDLTPQQQRVLALMSEGKLNKQIAHEMSVSEATVKAHVTAILRKLGVHSRTQAVIAARKALGLPVG
ncbi:MAG: DNA-binding response regulator [Alphaproteobacteria bacterium]|nr:response regulator transcription factor [Alphaproteobacteria bacterium]TAD88757.1 MAG: DNA-binding response regulator [Alphaproteobacteria bacterium]